ncbi:thiamine diphosphokinase [Schinkia azotoformans]|uniref:thiamine diphosphokinase n=1 Tax=Schinkia azotoformans TaxID=1454 RepID=UPI002DBAC814|nr:thiamine diphosphokinase [Schinkia azotoformans]MEC1717624.1 thiamine diphosphokinase [Schinkia azotoformans]MEC1747386.1 thiamine diphosphokinase [Schinkia azotoformans]MEC1758296.1 thiamine diphosphokinase [Schinkia azotoformans]MED4376726.1 thiamine diphosphokinase [Schinkia azotoformans]
MRVLIFSGGNLNTWALSSIKEEDYIIGVDRGAYFLYSNGIEMDCAIGDFDSVTKAEKERIVAKTKEIISCDAINKNETDTEMAFNFALNKQPKEILLFGVLGTRFDHSIANIQLLYSGLDAGIDCKIVDERNEIQLVNSQLVIHKNRFKNVSLLPLTFEVSGITLEGFNYPLTDATIRIGESLGISNILNGEIGKITIKSGILQVIKSND